MSKSEDTPDLTRYPNAGKLPREVLTSPSARFIAALVCGALAITWVANLGAMKLLDAYPQNRGYGIVRGAWDKLERMDAPAGLLVLGDSGCGHAIATEALEESLGGTVAEMCTLGNMGLLDDAWLLASHIERFGPPEGVLIVHVYDVWQRSLPPTALLAQVPLPMGYWRSLQPDLDLDGRQSVDVFMARHVPLVSERRSLKNLVKEYAVEVATLGGGTQNDGPEDPAMDTASIVRDLQRHRDYASGTRFTISPTNLGALDQIVDLADEYGFEVFIANSPLWDRLVADSAFRRYNAGVQEALASYASLHPAVYHVVGTVAFGVHSMTQTVDHIRPEPAQGYSLDLARRITILRSDKPIPTMDP